MSLRFICLAMMVGALLLGCFIYWLVRRYKMKQALVDSCLLCDSNQVTVRSRHGEYVCRHCAFDTDLEIDSGTRVTVDQFRDLKYALREFREGLKAMQWAQVASVADMAGDRSGAKYQKMDQATRHMMEGFRLLQDVMKEHPEFKEMPIPGENLTTSDLLADYLVDGVISNAIVLSRISESRQQVEAFVRSLDALSEALRAQLTHKDIIAAARARVAALSRAERAAALYAFDAEADEAWNAVDPSLRGDPAVQNRLLLPVAAGTMACVVVALAGWYLLGGAEPRPDKVLIAVAVPLEDDVEGVWWGDGGLASAGLADSLAGQLDYLGFDPIQAGDPEVLDVMSGASSQEDILKAAKRLDASMVVLGKLAPSQKRTFGGEGGAVELRLSGELRVVATDEDDYRPPAMKVDRTTFANSFDEAAEKAARQIANRDIAPLVEALTGHPTLQTLFERSERTREEVELHSKLRPARAYNARRRQEMHLYRESVALLDKEWRAQGEGKAVTELSTLDHEEYLVGVLPGKGGAVVSVTPREPVFWPRSDRLRYESPLERIDRVGLDGKERQTLVTAHNFYSYPGLAADGSQLVFVTDDYGSGQTLRALDLREEGRGLDHAVELLHIDEGYLSSPKVSADGKQVAVFRRDCRRCASALEIVSLADKSRRVASSPEQPASWVRWLDDGRLFFERRTADGQRELVLFGADQDATVVLEPSDTLAWSEPHITRDGRTLLLIGSMKASDPDGEEPDRYGLIKVDVASGAPSMVAALDNIRRLSPSHDGSTVAFEIRGQVQGEQDDSPHDWEIGSVGLGGGGVRLHTRNGVRDRYPHFAPDRLAVFFETQHDDPRFEADIMTVRWAAVEPPAAPAATE